MVPPSGCSTRVQNGNGASIGFSADGAAKALPQLFLHGRDDLGLDIAVQVGILGLFRVADGVRHRERQADDNQQRHTVPRKIHALPTRPCREQHRVRQLLERLHEQLPVAAGSQQGVRHSPLQPLLHAAHLVVGREQHQRVTVTHLHQLFNFLT